jgi:hypothetical protein
MAYNFNPNPPMERTKDNPEWVIQASKNRKTSSATCYSCRKFKTIGGDIMVEGEKFPLCPICARITEQIKIRKCNVCEKDFASINSLRTCFRCKGNKHKAKTMERITPGLNKGEEGK